MGRPDVLDLPRSTATGVHDLHRAGTRRRPHRADVRGRRPTIEPRLVLPSETLDTRSRRSAHRSQREAAIVSKVRSEPDQQPRRQVGCSDARMPKDANRSRITELNTEISLVLGVETIQPFA
jgi:hypothetical protein